MTDSVPRAVVDAFYEAYASHDTARIAPLLHDDIEWTTSGPVDVLSWCGTRYGKPAVVDLIGRVFPSLFQVTSVVRTSMLTDGNRAASLNRLTARCRADGRVISYRLAHFMRFQDNKLISKQSLIDSFDVVEQMLGHQLNAREDNFATGNSDLVAV